MQVGSVVARLSDWLGAQSTTVDHELRDRGT